MEEFLKEIVGEGSLPKFLAALVFACIGALLSLLLHTTRRDVTSAKSPLHFSWSFLWSDNAKRLVASLLLIIVFIRFGREFLGADVTMKVALLIGFANDKLAQLLKSKGFLGQEKLPGKDQ